MIISVIPDTIDEKSRISSIIYENKLQIKDINFISIEEGQVPYMDIMFINIISPQLVLLIKNLLKKEYTSPHETYFIMRKSQKKDIDNLKRLKWDEIDGEWIYTQYSYKTKYGSTEMKSLFLNEEDVIYGENDDV
ncbi:MAG: hypothetical protein JXB49_02335 [Bacteroidales bacterium]|nr:hypothetical protein [Bacteroidales bacterium]